VVAHPAPAALSGGLATAARAVLVATLAALYVESFVVGAARIPSGSMEPTLLAGDRILVDRIIFSAAGRWSALLPVRQVARGDVVWFRSPEDPEMALVKRCVALAGDRFGGETLASGRLALVGDHRENSRDSRFFGSVARDAVGGRVFLVLWSAETGAGVRWRRVLRVVR